MAKELELDSSQRQEISLFAKGSKPIPGPTQPIQYVPSGSVISNKEGRGVMLAIHHLVQRSRMRGVLILFPTPLHGVVIN
jgi:hypothetical protein